MNQTPLEQVERCYAALLQHYGDAADRHHRAAAKLLLVALDQMRRHGGPQWAATVNEFVSIAVHEPLHLQALMDANRGRDKAGPGD